MTKFSTPRTVKAARIFHDCKDTKNLSNPGIAAACGVSNYLTISPVGVSNTSKSKQNFSEMKRSRGVHNPRVQERSKSYIVRKINANPKYFLTKSKVEPGFSYCCNFFVSGSWKIFRYLGLCTPRDLFKSGVFF